MPELIITVAGGLAVLILYDVGRSALLQWRKERRRRAWSVIIPD